MTDQKILNVQQQEAISHVDGPLLIIAGAGTGKTTVVTERIKHLILDKNILPSNVLALTFTEKAAQEMEERVDVALPYGYSQLWIATFHAFCDRILRNEAIHIGLNPSYKLMTQAETVLFLRKNIFKLSLDYFRPLGNPNKFLEGLIQHFSRLSDEDISPEQYLQFAHAMKNPVDDEIKKTIELAEAFKIYEELKAKEGFMDFSNLITYTLKLFRTRENILKNYQDQFHYIMVDEFQDTNFAQNQLAILLAGDKKNITVVGDDDQAIYRWRGAAISNIIQFRKHFPQAKIIALTKNYRSTQEILDKSYDLIQYNNPDRLETKEHIDKKLFAARNIKGKSVELLFAARVEDEADQVVNKIINLVETKKYLYKDFALLVRANDHAQSFVRSLQNQGIPYQFLGPGKLFHQDEIKDIIAYLRVLANFEDSSSLYRVLTMHIFAIEARDIAAILNFAKRKNIYLFETLERISEGQSDITLQEHTKKKIEEIVTMIKNHLKRVPKETAGQILYYFLQDSGMLTMMVSPKKQLDEKKAQNIAKFFEKLKTFESEHEEANVFAVVEWIDLAMQMGESPLSTDMDWSENNAVNILTIHSSKGLEFPVVFLVNLVNQRFPTRERHEQIPIPSEIVKEILPEGDYHLQEERRLFYVGMTRARDQLYLTAANFYGEGKRERKISPFVAEALGQEYVDMVLNRQKVKSSTIQPTLLEWAEQFNQKTITVTEKTPSNSLTYLSYSQITCFDMCPLHYQLRYTYRVPAFPSPAQSFGISVHGALRDYFQKIVRGEKISPDEVETLLNAVWIDEGYASKSHEEVAKQKAVYVLKKYIEKELDFLKKSAKKTIATEIPFKFFVKNDSIRPMGIQFGGRIDRVDMLEDNTIEIIDYKTGNNMPDEKKLKNDLQLTAYALAAVEVQDNIFKRKPTDIKLSLHYLEEDTILTTTRTIEQLEEAKKTILQKAIEIESSDFLCNGSLFCRACEYKMICQG